MCFFSLKVPFPVALQVPILAQDPPTINRVCTVHKMTTLRIIAEHKQHHRLQPGRCLNDHLNLKNLCQALESGEDGVEDKVVSSINLFGDQTFLAWHRAGQVLLFQVSSERPLCHILQLIKQPAPNKCWVCKDEFKVNAYDVFKVLTVTHLKCFLKTNPIYCILIE